MRSSDVSTISVLQQGSHTVNLAVLTRSASAQNGSKIGNFGLDNLGEDRGARTAMLSRGASFRRQGSSGMTWTDNWILTDDGVFPPFGRNRKVDDDKLSHLLSKAADGGSSTLFPPELKRSRSVGGEVPQKRRPHNRSWGFRWLKKNFLKAFR